MSRTVLLVLLTANGTGCRVCENAFRTLVAEPVEYFEHGDRRESHARSRVLAESAWNELACACPEVRFSGDYADGFMYGYAEYVHAGGRALPPPLPLPPRKYWNVERVTPEGRQAAREWLAGAREGIETARQSGLRELVVVPSDSCGATMYSPPMVASPAGTPVEVSPKPPLLPGVPPPPTSEQVAPAIRIGGSDPKLVPPATGGPRVFPARRQTAEQPLR